ncbi:MULTISPECIES: DNA/RNA non-specific endonuclease [unclassified Bacillus cereus group]|uniref:DNA/RNA non-specific endonuclease n=1 Tax=unclassified Bacillus cereus group TaxID=2750818 RepID=UPI001F599BFD|nr:MULTISPECIES: DNA/RNA non-specific endonuclease [unclassified Bacillus cereus group]
MVQSLKDHETLKNAFHTWKKTKVPVAIRSADTGMGIKIPYIEHATVGEIAANFARVRRAAKDDAYQLAKGNGGSGVKGTGNTPKITEIKEGDLGKHIIKGKNGRKELAPNVRYITEDSYKYTTDELGRIVDVEAEELILQKGKRNTGMQVAAGREDRLPDDDGGHLIGTQFHGSGDIDNLVAQNKQVNRSGGEWYSMEKEWANALSEIPPKKVYVKIEPVYQGTSLRPNYFEIVYEIEGKGIFEKTIRNRAGG